MREILEKLEIKKFWNFRKSGKPWKRKEIVENWKIRNFRFLENQEFQGKKGKHGKIGN